MRDRPNGAALLEVARLSLLEQVAPALKGQPRYLVLMVANAIGVAAREIKEKDRYEHAWNAVARVADDVDDSADARVIGLAKSLRSAEFDAHSALYRALTEAVEVAASIWKPAKPAQR